MTSDEAENKTQEQKKITSYLDFLSYYSQSLHLKSILVSLLRPLKASVSMVLIESLDISKVSSTGQLSKDFVPIVSKLFPIQMK